MHKNDQMILAVSCRHLFQNDRFEGFCPAEHRDYEQRILKHPVWMRRGHAEEDPHYKQPIAYALIINPQAQKLFAYQRASQTDYDESRLRGKWSWGIGGHVDQQESPMDSPLLASLHREIREETNIHEQIEPQLLGYINDDRTDVGRVHFGLLYLIGVSTTQIQPRDPEIAHGRLLDFSSIDKILASPECQVESWSRIAYEQFIMKFV